MPWMYGRSDPDVDLEVHMMAMDILTARRPVCQCCGNHIQEDEALHFTDKEIDLWLCLSCIERNMEYIEVD